ncbi:MAG: hypothetical protein P8L18_02005 [Verrucomicrobiota bacterium]|nr:hypothetical protein [Verrucomicrobiota bacterium]
MLGTRAHGDFPCDFSTTNARLAQPRTAADTAASSLEPKGAGDDQPHVGALGPSAREILREISLPISGIRMILL